MDQQPWWNNMQRCSRYTRSPCQPCAVTVYRQVRDYREVVVFWAAVVGGIIAVVAANMGNVL